MTEHRPERRARTVALVGLVFEVLLTAFFALLTAWSGSEATRALTLLSGIGVTIWFVLALVYHQRVLVQEEMFESEQLRKEREGGLGGAIFEVDEEQLLLARRRLQWMYKWLVPVFSVIVIVELACAGFLYWSWSFRLSLWADEWRQVQNTGLLIWFIGGAAFLSFLLSRYAVGMARQREWQLLRAGASWLMGITLAAVALAITLGVLHFFKTPVPEHVVAKVLRGLLLVLAAEIALNQVLDLYRPRLAGEEPRPAFDSRLLGLFSEPGGIARSIADAINYQFGFEVSSTWFYQLLQRSVVPLIGFAVLALLAASSLVFVGNNEVAVVERFGQILSPGPKGVLEPGLHFKWPWPIDVARKVAAAQVHELKIGLEAPKTNAPKDQAELILWTNTHSQEPHLEVLVATPKLAEFLKRPGVLSGGSSSRPAAEIPSSRPAVQPGEAVAVSLMRVAVSLQYQIRNAREWVATYENPEEMLKTLANREIIRYCASVDVDGLIGAQRGEIEQALWRAIQAAADRVNLGVDVVFLGLQGVHPPELTAHEFQDVVGAEQRRAAAIHAAEAEYNKKLSEAAGDVMRGEQLGSAIRELSRLEGDSSADPAVLEASRQKVKRLFFGDAEAQVPPVGGKAAETMVKAQAERWFLEHHARALAEAFEQEMIAKRAAPEVFHYRKVYEALAALGENVRKYVMATDGTLQLNLQDPMSAPLETSLDH